MLVIMMEAMRYNIFSYVIMLLNNDVESNVCAQVYKIHSQITYTCSYYHKHLQE